MVTIRQVAKQAGVSIATVSHVLNDKGQVSPRTRARVLAVVKKLDYRRCVFARGLRKRQSRLVAAILPSIAYPLFPEMTKGIEDEASRCDYRLVVCSTEESEERERAYVSALSAQWVDGIIYSGGGDGTSHIGELQKGDTPVVGMDRILPNRNLSCVIIDNVKAAEAATQHLLDLGHSRIAYLRGPGRIAIMAQRVEGYLRAHAGAGISPFQVVPSAGTGDWMEDGRAAMQWLLDNGRRPSAVFAANDLMAIGAIKRAKENGLRIPEDLAVVGFDDIAIVRVYEPALTTIAQPAYEMGRESMRLLFGLISGEITRPTVVVLPAKLVIRQSTVVSP
jgi:DNA-binding LacI/PurR family transcriptional regulator